MDVDILRLLPASPQCSIIKYYLAVCLRAFAYDETTGVILMHLHPKQTINALPAARLSQMDSPPSSAPADRVSRFKVGTTACVRCRQKKKRCDRKLPRCRPCESAGVECYGFEPAANRQVPRGYVQSLEERVAFLESKLRDDGAPEEDLLDQQPSTATRAPGRASESGPFAYLLEAVAGTSPETASSHSHAVLSDITTRPLEAIRILEQSGVAKPEAEFSKLLLRGLLLARPSHCRGQQEQLQQPTTDFVDNLNTGPSTLPAKEVAENLTREFFLSANLGMPLLHEPTFTKKLALVYEMPHVIDLTQTHTTSISRIAVFFVLEVFAIALLTMQKQDPARIPTSVADRYHQAALSALMEAGLPEGVEGVQALLLIGQYFYFHPTLWTVWNTVGAAFRLAVELGLHLDPTPADSPDALTLDIRRRTFWVAYSMDRNISISQGLPSCLSDGAIDVKFPTGVDDHLIKPEGIETSDEKLSGSKLVSIHLFRYRQIQSEMRMVLNEKPPPPYGPVNMEQWQQRMRDRINRWFETTPAETCSTPAMKR
ncbi:hypothetical protein V2G26_007813 [Clonostachys chloroleuca]